MPPPTRGRRAFKSCPVRPTANHGRSHDSVIGTKRASGNGSRPTSAGSSQSTPPVVVWNEAPRSQM